MNSLKGVEKALEYEAQRQEEVLRSGGEVIQQTFLWDPSTNRSIPMRSKEDAHDYRYFPEPDLMPLMVDQKVIDSLKESLPELPTARRARFEKQYEMPANASEVLTSERALADYFEVTVNIFSDARQVANWIMTDILRIINDQKISISQLRITPSRLASLLKLIQDGTVSAKAARKVIDLIHSEDKEPAEIIDQQGLRQVSDSNALETAVKKVLDANPEEVERYKSGNKKLISFFVGQTMKATKGAGNPKEINSILAKLLG
jgi:aspartyl-tRNA(Asn)/glutamyl-tRNA(Gln) amidotransferase subunit B